MLQALNGFLSGYLNQKINSVDPDQPDNIIVDPHWDLQIFTGEYF
jgi:hypothetical protein